MTTNSISEDEDDKLMVLIAEGDSTAFTTLFNKYYDAIHRYLISMIGQNDAEDLTQETFFRVLNKNASRYNPKGKFKRWIFRIARNLALNWMKKHRPSLVKDEEEELLEDFPDDKIDLLDKLVDEEMKDLLKEYIEELSQIHREIIHLYYYEELSAQEIAEILDSPMGTVQSRLHRARHMLKAKIVLRIGRP